MLKVNEERSGQLDGGVGDAKFLIVLESESRDEIESAAAKRMALDVASRYGWGNAGLDPNVSINAVDAATDECMETLDPKQRIKCYRGEFVIAKKL